MRTKTQFVGIGLLLISLVAQAQQADVTFFVIGKHANFVQDDSGRRTSDDFSFFSEIFLTENGDANRATLTLPTGERVDYKDQRQAEGGDQDNILLISSEKRFESFQQLQARYPDGRYQISFKTPSGRIARKKLHFKEGGLPAPPQIELTQAEEVVCRTVDPDQELRVSWSAFDQGGADPNEILDDLIFVILTDEHGNRVAHSGRPLEGTAYLNFAASDYSIGTDVLKPNQTYTLSVEHAILDDTRQYKGIPAMTTRAVTTKLEIRTHMNGDELQSCKSASDIPSISSQTVMFYYKELDAAGAFYGDALGLEKTLDWSWIKMYKTGPAGTVGLVQEGEGAYHTVQPRNAVMLSLVTEEVDAWYKRVQERDDVTVLKSIGDGGGIRSFMLEDPGGYTVEFYQWLEQ